MGKVIINIIWVVSIIIGILIVVRLCLGGSNSAIYKIYINYPNYNIFYKQLGIVPSSFKQRFLVDTINHREELSLYCYRDRKSPNQSSFIVYNSEGKELFLKAFPFNISGIENSKYISDENILSYLVNLNVFNKYLGDFEIRNEKLIVFLYLRFMSGYSIPENFYLVENVSEIDEIIKKYPILPKDEFIYHDEIVDHEVILELVNNRCPIYWFVNYGFVQFCFVIEDGKIIKVESVKLGYLGNEFPTCC